MPKPISDESTEAKENGVRSIINEPLRRFGPCTHPWTRSFNSPRQIFVNTLHPKRREIN